MSQLISRLKLDHNELSKLFCDISLLGITTEESQNKLLNTKELLLAHLKKEDDELYPHLWEIAKGDNRLKLILESFENDMKNVTTTILAFFEKYKEGKIGSDFKTDFQKMYMILTKRINREEIILFPEYEHIHPLLNR